MSRGRGSVGHRAPFVLARHHGGSHGDSLPALLSSTHKHQGHKEDQTEIPRAVSTQMAPVPDCLGGGPGPWGSQRLGKKENVN